MNGHPPRVGGGGEGERERGRERGREKREGEREGEEGGAGEGAEKAYEKNERVSWNKAVCLKLHLVLLNVPEEGERGPQGRQIMTQQQSQEQLAKIWKYRTAQTVRPFQSQELGVTSMMLQALPVGEEGTYA